MRRHSASYARLSEGAAFRPAPTLQSPDRRPGPAFLGCWAGGATAWTRSPTASPPRLRRSAPAEGNLQQAGHQPHSPLGSLRSTATIHHLPAIATGFSARDDISKDAGLEPFDWTLGAFWSKVSCWFPKPTGRRTIDHRAVD